MGEAGPEGIFPLKRGPDGKLGVSASGAGGGNSYHIYAPGADEKMLRQIYDLIERTHSSIKPMALDAIAEFQARGGA